MTKRVADSYFGLHRNGAAQVTDLKLDYVRGLITLEELEDKLTPALILERDQEMQGPLLARRRRSIP